MFAQSPLTRRRSGEALFAARMAALIGPARTKLILMGGAKLTADEALSFGLVDEVIPASELGPFTTSIAQDALGATPGHISAIKALIA